MSEKEGRIIRIEKELGVKSESEQFIEYGEYVRAVKSILAEMGFIKSEEKSKKKFKGLEECLENSSYGKILKEELRKNIPRVIEKLKEEKIIGE